MKLAIRIGINAVALWVATAVLSGIALTTASTASKVGTIIVVAIIFGVVNGVLKPVIKTVGCAFYVLTLGLVAFVVNGLLLWLVSWIAGTLNLPFHVDGFWPALWGAIIIGLVSWILGMFVGDDNKRVAR